MAPFRSQETLQREHELQAPYTVQFNLNLQSYSDKADYRSKLEDTAIFANQIRARIEGDTHVLQTSESRIWIYGYGENYKVSLWVDGNCWGFEINDTTHYELNDTAKIGPSLAIKKIWDVVIPLLPENFIIRGIINPDYPGHDVRMALLERLGFSSVQPNREVFSIKKDGALRPLTLEAFLELTKTTPQLLQQKLSAKKIDWPGV